MMIRAAWDVYRIPKLTFMQKLRFLYVLSVILTQLPVMMAQFPIIPAYLPYIEEEETMEQTEERVSALLEGVKGLKTL